MARQLDASAKREATHVHSSSETQGQLVGQNEGKPGRNRSDESFQELHEVKIFAAMISAWFSFVSPH